MCLLFFSTPSDKTGKAIMQAIKTQLPDESMDLCATAGSLALKLSEHRNDEKMAILIPADEEKLIDVYSIKNLFNGVPVMLILPNKDTFVEAMGYLLRPRIMCYRDTGVMEAVSKLANIAKSLSNLRVDSIPTYRNGELSGYIMKKEILNMSGHKI